MNLIYAVAAFLLALIFVLVGATRLSAWLIERRNPPIGSFITVNGTRMHYVHVPEPVAAAVPPVVFIHGASANLKDQMLPLRPRLEGRAEMLFFDRPGHGWSSRGADNEDPVAQARTIAALMRAVGIEKAVIVGHSFGGGIAAAFAFEHPEMVAGLVLVSAATHPWPGGNTSWYYELASRPFVGRLFVETVTALAGLGRMRAATACVFAPNPVPDSYTEAASIKLVLRPGAFRANAIDVEGLYRHALANARRYREIAAPTVVISGDYDTVVYEELHSMGLARDIPGAELVWVRNLGHKPDWTTPELVAGAIEQVAGGHVDLQAMARVAESRIAGDRAPAGCVNEKMSSEELAPI